MVKLNCVAKNMWTPELDRHPIQKSLYGYNILYSSGMAFYMILQYCLWEVMLI